MSDYLDPETFDKLIQSAIIAAIALTLFVGLKGRILKFAAWARLPRLALTPVRLTIRFSILIVAALLILSRWGFQINGIIAVIGTVLGLVAIGFVAMWSVLSNFLCTLVLVVLKPFYVGDDLELPTANVRGKVIDLSVVYTALESGAGETILVPNNMFFQLIYKRRHGTVRMDLETQLGQAAPAHSAMCSSLDRVSADQPGRTTDRKPAVTRRRHHRRTRNCSSPAGLTDALAEPANHCIATCAR